MNFSKFLIASIFFISSIAFCQQGNKSEVGGPPARNEIIGFLKMVNLPKLEKMNKENPWPQKYQWFAFFENGNFFSMMMDKDSNYSKEELTEVFKVMSSNNSPNFEYKGKFVVISNPEIKGYREIWGINLFAKDVGNSIKKGDLMMSLDDGSGKGNGSIVYYRLLRKIE